MGLKIDAADRRILTILHDDATTAKAEIARRVGLTASAVFERIRKLEKAGVIRGYRADVDPAAAGLEVLAFVLVSEEKPVRGEPTSERLARVEGVEEVHKVAGEDCWLVKLRAVDTRAIARILDDRIGTIESVRGTRTTIVLETLLEGRQAAVERLRGGSG